MKLKAALVLLLTLSQSASGATIPTLAAGVVEGVVRSTDGTPLPHAHVALAGTPRGTTTDGAGQFALRGVAPGRYRLEATMLGYRTAAVDIVVAATGAAVSLEILMEPTPLSIPGVQVTATPGSREALGTAQATTQLSGRQLERSLGGTLARTLEGQPGMGVRYNGPAAASPVLRGMTGDRILILQDGQRVADLSGSADDHSVTVDPLGVQRIEVVRGPASLLYGTNALGGVVNVISGDISTSVPQSPQWSAGLQSESAFPGIAASARAMIPLSSRWVLTARGSGRTTGDARIGSDPELGTRLDNTFHRNAVLGAGLGHAGDRMSGGFSIQAYAMEHGVPLPPEEDDEIVLQGRRVTAAGNVEVRLGSAGFPSMRLQGSATDYAHDELEDGDVEMAFGLRTLSLETLVRQAAGGVAGEGAWGASALMRSYAATGAEQLTAPADSRSFGVFTFQELSLGARGAALQAGARVDRWDIESRDDPSFGPGVRRGFTALSGSAGATMPLAAGISVGLSTARSFRAPTVEELFSHAVHIGTASYEIGDPDLRPEIATGADVVLRADRSRLTAEASAYASRVGNFIFFEARGDTITDGVQWPVLAYAQGSARFRGAEGRVEWEARPHWVLTVQGDVVRATLADGSPVPFLPPARVGGAVRRDDGRWTAGAGVRHGLSRQRVAPADEAPTDAWTLLDLDAGLRVIRRGQVHSLTVRADNVLDVLYRDAASRIKDFAPNPGRNVSLLYRVWF
jgi:iron complex outermembrane recepter protein